MSNKMPTRKSNWLPESSGECRGETPDRPFVAPPPPPHNHHHHHSHNNNKPPARPAVSSQPPGAARHSQRLYLDNLKLWDCLALVRSDVSMSCQSAINLIFNLSNADYLRAFPDALQSVQARFPGGEVRYSSVEEAEDEDMRLREENVRLHAAVWVLRDNPQLHADSALAAIFRLGQEQFRDKFPFDYESGGVGNLRSGTPTRLHKNKSRMERTPQHAKDRATAQHDGGEIADSRGGRCRSSSEKRNRSPNPQSQNPIPHRRSSSTWGREDFASNWTSNYTPQRSRNMPEPPMAITQGVKSRLTAAQHHVSRLSHCGIRGGDFNNVAKSLRKRSPSAMGRIEGQRMGRGGGGDEDHESDETSTWMEDEIEKCSGKLGLEINGPHKSQSHGGGRGGRPKVTFADQVQKRRCFYPIHPSLDNLQFIDHGRPAIKSRDCAEQRLENFRLSSQDNNN